MGKKKGQKKKTKLAMQNKKLSQFALWYPEAITKSEMIDYYDVSGCYILRPWSFKVWEEIKQFFDGEIKKLGVENAYFPMFVKKCHLEKEKDHVEGFAAEVAWVTKSGQSDLKEHIAIRPTSETIMYPAFANWIQSHRDLPLKLNQWTNVVRWEFKHPTPFLRTREFLWQEGHTAFSNVEEADEEVFDILDLYARVYEELLAVPVIKGRKSEGEKFPGGRMTTTVEAYIPAAGRAIQGATSHSLGQNFSRMFGITFDGDDEAKAKAKAARAASQNGHVAGESKEADKLYAWQNSWGLTTRTIGVMVMVHGDDKGIVMPPRVAPLQVIIIWTYSKKTEEAKRLAIKEKCRALGQALKAQGVRAKVDDRTDNKTAGWKYSHWELRGVPLRIEMGPRDLDADQVMTVRRDDGSKAAIPLADAVNQVPLLLEQIQADMLAKARQERDAHISVAHNMDEFMTELNKGNLILTPWCELMETEEWVKEQTKICGTEQDKAAKAAKAAAAASKGEELDEAEEAAKGLTGAAKTLCLPFNQMPLPAGTMCFTGNGEKATAWCLWGRSY